MHNTIFSFYFFQNNVQIILYFFLKGDEIYDFKIFCFFNNLVLDF